MNIAGMGIMFHRGRGRESLEKALGEGWVLPEGAVYSLPEEALRDRSVLKEMRRADKFSKMACLAAHDAFADSGLGEEARNSLGIILTTAFGPQVTTFRFLDDILDYGDANVSPTIFSHSVHNAAASYIAFVLQSRGPTLTLTRFAHSFSQGLILAETWLKSGRCQYVLVGSADECGGVMEYICGQKLRVAGDGIIRPFLCAKEPAAVPGEGSAFFLVSNNETPGRYCSISAFPGENAPAADMRILDCDGMTGSEEVYRREAQNGAAISSYTPIFGSIPTVSGLSCAAAALMLKGQRYYASPARDNPHGFNISQLQQSAAIKTIHCVRYGCRKERIEIRLKK
ncbi:MAG: beta-ketoacyl synthase N-terminal-like domain-containing protein [Candidatus Omnitrophota bacterium]